MALRLGVFCVGCRSAQTDSIETQIFYESAVVSYLGPEGTYTQEACGTFFEKQGSYIPCKTVGEAAKARICGDSDYAVIPQENTIGGAVIDYVDTLLMQTAVFLFQNWYTNPLLTKKYIVL